MRDAANVELRRRYLAARTAELRATDRGDVLTFGKALLASPVSALVGAVGGAIVWAAGAALAMQRGTSAPGTNPTLPSSSGSPRRRALVA